MLYYLATSINLGWNQFYIAVSKSSDPELQILITLLVFIILYLWNNKLEAICCVFNIGITGFTNLMLKNTVQRSRPLGVRLVEADGYSFPSGHSSISTAIGIVLIYFILKRMKNKKIAYLLSCFIFAYLILVGVSRVYVGVHYPTDVLGGWVIAILWSFISLAAYRFCMNKGLNEYLDKHFTIKLNIFKHKPKSK
ncbi:phosphatase PAP2 family protein [Clostridium sp. CM027]|uniref:phosphatase PAP2 family protein n=1 Tax=Clostridium sp. CM027 TaxID=2849865 RepID=UPI001C6EEA12|nr:phosphatase PAP2 family protein [Clostridium sp. CM027]MBW9144508.1 phosphatase PAP2 family protein [Clostridium sp. CM027]UVE40721.1 phosphatase PAP2 family protein [Clostridium sp. CM027]